MCEYASLVIRKAKDTRPQSRENKNGIDPKYVNKTNMLTDSKSNQVICCYTFPRGKHYRKTKVLM